MKNPGKIQEKIKNTFGREPQGIWPSEHCISQKTIDVLANLGVKWVISDESVLSNSLKKEFVRDFRGCYKDPYDVCSLYLYKTKQEKEINLIFRDSMIPNLIGFEYPHHDPVKAANDLYDRIKTIQRKIGVPSGGAMGLITPTNIIVQIIAKESLTIEGISLLDKTGASLIIPTKRKKTIIPLPRAVLISGKKVANCFKISSNIYSFNYYAAFLIFQ